MKLDELEAQQQGEKKKTIENPTVFFIKIFLQALSGPAAHM